MSGDREIIRVLALAVAAAAVIGVAAWIIADSPASVSRAGVRLPAAAGETVFVAVEAGDTAAAIGARLEAAGVIRDAASFERLARLTGAERSLAAGDYEFLAGTSVLDAVQRIRDGLTATRVVVIPEGLRLEEVADRLERRGVLAAADFLAAANALARAGAFPDADLLARPARGCHPRGLPLPRYL